MDFQISSPKVLDFPISKFLDFQPQGSRFQTFQISTGPAPRLQISKFPEFQPQSSRFSKLQISSPKAPDFPSSKSWYLGAGNLEIWNFGNLEIWKSRTWGLEIRNSGNLEIWTLGNLESWGWKYGISEGFINNLLKLSYEHDGERYTKNIAVSLI